MIQDAPPALPEVVVTGARLPPAAGDAAFSVTRLDRSALDRSTRLDEALGRVPAVSLFRRTSSLAANPTTQGISLRAIAPSGAGRALVTLDNVPLNDPFGGWVLWSQVAPESLDSLDLVRGAGAGAYGAGALTGVIALRERDGEGGRLDVSAGGYGGRRVAAVTGLRAGRVAITASALADHSDGYTPVRSAAAGAADTPLDLDTRSAALRADVELDGATALSMRASAYDEDRGSGLLNTRSTATGHSVSATLARTPARGRPGWRIQAWRRESDFANASASVAANRSGTTPANDQYATPATGWGGNLAVRQTGIDVAGGRLEWEVGADARLAEGESQERFSWSVPLNRFTRDRFAGGETSVVGGYVEASWTRDIWLVAGGLRVDRWGNAGGRRLELDRATGTRLLDESYADRSGEVTSARLGVRRDLGQGFAARAAAYSGFRPATINELHRPFRVGNDITEANAALEPERLQGGETGLSWEGASTRLGATLFWNRIEDAIVNGLELNAEHRLDRITLSAALAWTDAQVDGGTAAAQLTGLRPAQAPEWSATAGIDWQATDRLNLSLNARYESARFDDDLNSRTLDAAVTADARAGYRVGQGVSLYAAVDVSLTGDGVAGYAAPRVARVGITLDW